MTFPFAGPNIELTTGVEQSDIRPGTLLPLQKGGRLILFKTQSIS